MDSLAYAMERKYWDDEVKDSEDKKGWTAEVPYWHRVDGSESKKLDGYDISTQRSMLQSLYKAKDSGKPKAYLINIDNKIEYLESVCE